jgi:hypothetical protein
MDVIGSLAFITILSFSHCVPTGVSSALVQSGERDLRSYEKFGPLIVTAGTNPGSVMSNMRDFVWQHWEQHRLGYVVFTLHTKEGEPSTSYVFIEPDESGFWHLSVRIERKLIDRRGWSDPKYKGRLFHQTATYKAYAIERVTGSSNSCRLRLKDKDGKAITDW